MSVTSNRILGDKYRLLRPLDKGGMGSVWLAEHLTLASPVAVKVIGAEVARTSTRLQRFLREARAAAAARSPNVVQIIDYGVDAGTPYIVMELLEGESLAERLKREGRASPRDTEAIIRQVSRGLTRVHDAGIVHRDLKPANIFITRNQDEEVIKLFDFGIAKATTELNLVLTNQTRTGSIFGTPFYMSPEQMEASRRCDLRTDIWAMGVITFECLLGRVPFAGTGIGGLVLSVCSHPLPVPSELGAVPEGFDAWFARACARNRRERFSTAREAAQELRRLIEPGFVATEWPREAHGSGDRLVSTVLLNDASEGSSLDRSASRTGSPAAAFESTASASSATVDRHAPRRRPKPWVIATPIVGCLTLAIAMHEYPPTPADTEQALQSLEPVREAAGVRVLGDGSALSLSVDGKPVGALPRDVQGLDPGEHSLTITGSPRYRPFEARVNLAPGAVTSVGPVKLAVAKGLATIALGPGAEGAEVTLKSGATQVPLPPLPLQLEVETDKSYTLLARKADYALYEEPLTFENGQAEKTFSIALVKLEHPAGAERERHRNPARRPDVGRSAGSRRSADPMAPPTLTFLSTPRSAVLLDGEPLGSTPLRKVPVEAGSHRVIFIHGARRKSVSVKSVTGRHGTVSTRFAPAPGAD